jgi:hypothetical protein
MIYDCMLVSTYLFSTYVLSKVMTIFDPFVLNKCKIIYNTFQILVNSYILYNLYLELPLDLTNPFGLNTPFNDNISKYIYLHYLTKYFDFFDTFFIVLGKKARQLSFLHLYHHSSIVLMWKYAIVTGDANGTVAFSVIANSFIHVIMYFHYLLTTLNIRNPFKFLVTKCQMSQFLILIIHSYMALKYEIYVSNEICVLQIFYQSIMFVLFFNFLIQNRNKTFLKSI